jgi:hypothetical protein
MNSFYWLLVDLFPAVARDFSFFPFTKAVYDERTEMIGFVPESFKETKNGLRLG